MIDKGNMMANEQIYSAIERTKVGRFDFQKDICTLTESEKTKEQLSYAGKFLLSEITGTNVKSLKDALDFTAFNAVETIRFGFATLGAHMTPGVNAVIITVEVYKGLTLGAKTLQELAERSVAIEQYCNNLEFSKKEHVSERSLFWKELMEREDRFHDDAEGDENEGEEDEENNPPLGFGLT